MWFDTRAEVEQMIAYLKRAVAQLEPMFPEATSREALPAGFQGPQDRRPALRVAGGPPVQGQPLIGAPPQQRAQGFRRTARHIAARRPLAGLPVRPRRFRLPR